MLTRTFLQVFPDGRLVQILPNEAAMLATVGGGAHSAPDLDFDPAVDPVARATEEPVASHLAGIGVPDPSALPQAWGPALLRAIGPGSVVTDDHPKVEHFAVGLSWQRGDDADERRRFAEAVWGQQALR